MPTSLPLASATTLAKSLKKHDGGGHDRSGLFLLRLAAVTSGLPTAKPVGSRARDADRSAGIDVDDAAVIVRILGAVMCVVGGWMLTQNTKTSWGAPLVVGGFVMLVIG